MEHQYSPAEAIGADFETRSIMRKRIIAAIPRLVFFQRLRCVLIVFTVIKHDFETPVLWQRDSLGRAQAWKIRAAVAVLDALKVPVSRARYFSAIAFVRLRRRNVVRVLFLESVHDDIALVVVAFADQPAEDARTISGICNAAFLRLAIPGGDVVPGD